MHEENFLELNRAVCRHLTACLERVGNIDTRFAYLNDNSLNVAHRRIGITYGLLARPTKIPLEYPSGTLRFKLRFLSD